MDYYTIYTDGHKRTKNRKTKSIFTIYFLLTFNLLQDIIKAENMNGEPLTVPELIRKHGYYVEIHKVITEDGYILTLHRLPNHGSPVLLNHGILGTSAEFLILGPQQALAYNLHRAGYDVWMGNYRGNIYSKEHVFLNNTQFKFWQFGVHEMGVYDLPAEIDYILDTTNNYKINYVGFSLGTLYYWILMSERPEYNDKINQMHALAPMAYWGNEKTIINFEKILLSSVTDKLSRIRVGEVLDITSISKRLSTICSNPLLLNHCSALFIKVFGRSTHFVDKNLIPELIQFYPGGLSTRTAEHCAQLIDTGKFRQFDYGSKEANIRRYNSPEPPDYNLYKVTSPVFIQYALGDVIALPKNVQRLCRELGNCREARLVADPTFGHADFLWGSTAMHYVYEYLVEKMKCNFWC